MAVAGWEPLGFFVLRTPLLPFEDLLAVTDAAAGRGGEKAFAPREYHAHLLALARRPEVREAIFIASPSLEERLSALLDGETEELPQRLERPLFAYLARMATRPTPFGLFSAVATGRVAECTVLTASGDMRRHTRPDMDYLVSAAERLVADRDTRAAIAWRPNSSLYRSAGRLRMVETRRRGGARSHHLVALEPDEALLAVLAAAEGGAELDELAAAIVDDEIDLDEATGFLHDLIDAQVLVADLGPAITGPAPLQGLLADWQRVAPRSPAVTKAVGVLEKASVVLAELDAGGLGQHPALYRALAAELTTVVPDADISRLFQVDLLRAGPSPTVGLSVVAEAARAVDLLARVGPSRPDSLTRFRRAFSARYELAEVPLLEVLDEESGIGFEVSSHPAADESPLLDGLDLRAAVSTTRWSLRDDILLGLLARALQAGAMEVELDESLIAELEGARDRRQSPDEGVPATVSVMGRLAAASAGDVDEGRFRLLVESVQSASGAQVLGRFCHIDAALESAVREMLLAEESLSPEAVFAEIVHLPEGRIGNILCRPVLRGYEIGYLGRSGAPAEGQIAADDLMVSLVAGRVTLRSRRLGCEVIPRLTSAHITSRGAVGVYRFLGELQHQGRPELYWDWGPLSRAPFLPRVSCGRLVLSRAQWLVRDLRRPEDLDRMRSECGLPRWVGLRDSDQELLLDLDNAHVVSLALDLVKHLDEVTLVEMFPPADELCVTGPAGRYVHELVVPLVRQRPAAVGAPAPRHTGSSAKAARRQFAPGSEWLYAKLYTGTATADAVLRSSVAAVVRAAFESGAADGWFFLRYGDPDHHLRLRIHGDPERLRAEVEPLIEAETERLMSDGLVWRAGYDTYQRELERYGGAAGIDACEMIFSADSDAVLAIVDRLSGDAGLEARWQLCAVGIDRLLAVFGLSTSERRDWTRLQAAGFLAEFGKGPALARQLGQLWRRRGRDLQDLQASSGDSDHPLAGGIAVLEARSQSLAAPVDRLRSAIKASELTVTLDQLLASLAHMHANRLLRSAQRAQEMAIYELLARLYTAKLAREGE